MLDPDAQLWQERMTEERMNDALAMQELYYAAVPSSNPVIRVRAELRHRRRKLLLSRLSALAAATLLAVLIAAGCAWAANIYDEFLDSRQPVHIVPEGFNN